MHWMINRGLITDLEIVDIPGMGKGLYSNRKFTEGDVFLRIPSNLIITIETVEKELGSYSISEIQALVLYLASMKSGRLDGDWLEYLNAIPEDYILPMFMESEILIHSSMHLRDHVQKQLNAFNEDIRALLQLDIGLKVDVLKWAWLAVNTRCVTLRARKDGYPTIALMPFLDFLNHSGAVSVNSVYDLKTCCFLLHCNDTIEKDCQAFLCYGPHDNTFLACEYGFVEDNNLNDYVSQCLNFR